MKKQILRWTSPLVSCITLRKKNYLVVEPNPLKNMRTVKLDHFARDLGWKFQKVFELPPPRKFDDHHLKFLGLMFYLPVAEFRPQKINGWNLKVTHLERKIIFQPSFSSLSWNIRPLRSQFPSTGISSCPKKWYKFLWFSWMLIFWGVPFCSLSCAKKSKPEGSSLTILEIFTP